MVEVELCELSAHQQKSLLEDGKVSAVELLEAHLARVDQVNESVNAIVALDAEVGMRRAIEVDRARAAGEPLGALAGLVTAHKDLGDTADFVTTYGSPVFADHRPDADSLLVSRMKEEGAVAIGKTNTPEFGVGSHTFNPVYGTTFNPWDLSRSAGGSSGGAAAALATGMVAVADGSDMGGSLRNPAAWNNVLGFRASPGLVPVVRPGIARSTLGLEGAMARSVDDLALLLSVIGRPDVRDPLNRGVVVPPRIDPTSATLRVAFSPTLGGLPVESDVAAVIESAVSVMVDMGWNVEHAEPSFEGADDCFTTIRSFLSANGALSLLGDRVEEVKATVREDYELGLAASPGKIGRAYQLMSELWRGAASFFDDVDLLVAPVTQISPFPADQEYPMSVDGVPCERYLDWMRSCCRVTVLGLPALSLPAGFTAEGLPVGIQLIGGPHGDLALLRAAKALEGAIDTTFRRPPILDWSPTHTG